MKNKFLLLLWLITLSNNVFSQVDIDTLYYDSKWKGCEPAFASFYRVYSVPSDSNIVKRYRDYYITGELQSEGEYLSIDKYDDAKSVFDGEYQTFFRSGKIEQKGFRKNGLENGEYFRYNEDGLISQHAYFTNGNLNGLYTEFTDDNLCYQVEYRNGKPLNGYYTLSNKEGYCSRVDLITNKPIYVSPSVNDIRKEYQKGDTWLYYNENGLMVGMTNKKVKDYGKYFQIPIVIANNSLYKIEFDPINIKADLTDKKGEQDSMKVYQADEYLKKVKRRQNWAAALVGFSEGLSTAGAGYSTSYSNSYSNGIVSNGYSGSSTYSGYSTSVSTTYDAAVAYQARVLSASRMASFSESLLADRDIKDKGYLKRTTIYPGETVTGYINIARQKGVDLNITLIICGAAYIFPWDISEF